MTTYLGVCGWPVAHSRSPQMHNAALAAVGLADWRYLLAPVKWTRVRPLAEAVFVGWAATAILPGRVGEIARAVLIRQRLRATAAEMASAIAAAGQRAR